MFCYQCEQTFKGTGCVVQGICGKTPNVAILQDLLIYALKGLSFVAEKTMDYNLVTEEIDNFICKGLFITVTNVNFDEKSIFDAIAKTISLRDELLLKLRNKNCNLADLPDVATFALGSSLEDAILLGKEHNVLDAKETNPDIQSLKSTLLFGLKGTASYADHAAILGQKDAAIYKFIQKSLAALLRYDLSINDWINLVLECGIINLRTMELLDKGHNEHYGHPTPTQVSLGVKKGKAILVSGHDMRDLELLLKQTERKNIYVYTHGEMLPAHGYPNLKKYKHFAGHYGTAWQNQYKEFADFPGTILMTTNCIQKPASAYEKNIFTTGLVSWPNIPHIDERKDFTPVIERALALPGFLEECDRDFVNVGFAHDTVLGIAGKIVELIKSGRIRHFFLVAGCDGAKPGRNYYTEIVEKIPSDCMVLTLACGKFRFFSKDLGAIEGIPRLLDVGQCNDAYSAIKIAQALAEAFNCGINDLPLSFVLSWYEQKAVVILLTLFSLGIKNIRLGPSMPAFITPNVLKVLVDKFNIMPIATPDKDLDVILG
jgi:hydroxylamine reductase